MIAFFGKLWRNKRGNALAIAAAAMPLFIGAAGLATDTIQWTLWKRQLQRAADSAAIAGVYDRENAAGLTTNTKAAVAHDLTLNLHSFYALKSDATAYPDCANKCKVEYPADTLFALDQVKVTIAIQQPLTFSSFFMSTAPTITATSTAAAVAAGGSACFQATSGSSTDTGIAVSGNAGIEAPDCIMYSNPKSSNSAYAKGSSSVTVEAVAAVGGIQQSSNWHVEAYRPYSPTLPDPFINVNPKSSDMKCTTATLDEDTKMSDYPTGTNCFSALKVGSNKTLNLDSVIGAGVKTVYINGGDAFIQGNLTCSTCTIVMTNKDGATDATIGNFKVNADANVNMTAPTTGDFKGIAIYQDRRAQDKPGKLNLINGNSGSIIKGALYFPSQQLNYNGTGTTEAICTMFVAFRLDFTGNSTTTNKFKSLEECADYGVPSNNATRIVRLVG